MPIHRLLPSKLKTLEIMLGFFFRAGNGTQGLAHTECTLPVRLYTQSWEIVLTSSPGDSYTNMTV
jgi:hypothetical protein